MVHLKHRYPANVHRDPLRSTLELPESITTICPIFNLGQWVLLKKEFQLGDRIAGRV